ncbi:TPA: hypothetical protein DDW35_06250 [Candidatus Sumerlaeota bacterium]|nr:hypothetical protein [Candidatus Sumerlaeota bacterium]
MKTTWSSRFRTTILGCLVVLALALAGDVLAQTPLFPKDFPEPIRVACVGDSITQGSGTSSGKSYPEQLQQLLGADWEVGNFGVSGRTLLRNGDFPYWKELAFRNAQAFQPNAVIIMLGTNDTKPKNWAHRDEFAKDYTDLVNIFSALSSKPRVYVCRPTFVPEPGNYGISETNLLEEIKVIDKIAVDLKLDVIDMHATLVDKPALLPDRVHPNDSGAAEMAKTAAQALVGNEVPAPMTRVNKLFRSHSVLQRGVPLPVWGTAPSEQKITVEFAGQKISTTAKDGKWEITLKALKASATPQKMTVTGSNVDVVEDILVGDVWLAGGQSNMERQVGPRPGQKELVGWKEAVATANYPLIREFTVPHVLSSQPETTVRGQWNVCTPSTAAEFSAVGFFFARDLQPAIKVPVGIIHSSWGGTCAEAWTSSETLRTLGDIPELKEKAPNAPSQLFNAMIAPFVHFPIKGVIWYQGENNSKRGKRYHAMLTGLIGDWRKQWKIASLPFLVVQIAPYKTNPPEVREGQFLTVKNTPHTALVVTSDIGDANDIHPANKQPVGARLALAARAVAYGEKIEYSGPMFDSMKIKDAKVTLSFTHANGLVAKEGELKGFTIAGADQKFVPAKAEIQGKNVVVWSTEVTVPIAVRYGWDNVPNVNLFNKAGLPASPFRTDWAK